jgi:hypothetical protein
VHLLLALIFRNLSVDEGEFLVSEGILGVVSVMMKATQDLEGFFISAFCD